MSNQIAKLLDKLEAGVPTVPWVHTEKSVVVPWVSVPKKKVPKVDPWPAGTREVWRGRSQKPWMTRYWDNPTMTEIRDIFEHFHEGLGCPVRGVFMHPDTWETFRKISDLEIYFNWDVGFSREGLGGHLYGVPIVIGPRIPKGRVWFVGDYLPKQTRNVVRRPCIVLCV